MEVSRGGKPITLFITAINSLPTVDSLSDLTNPKKDLIPSLGVFVVDLNRPYRCRIAGPPLQTWSRSGRRFGGKNLLHSQI